MLDQLDRCSHCGGYTNLTDVELANMVSDGYDCECEEAVPA